MNYLGVKDWGAGLLWIVVVVLFALLLPLSRAGGAPGGEGETTYKAKCSVCHSADGSGKTAMGTKLKLRDLRSPEVQKQTDAELLAKIAKGKSPMPGYEKQLGQEKIRDVVAYIRELGKKK